MRLAVVTDIHANLEALEAALEKWVRQDVDHVLCLGDIVGYGPDPLAVVDRMQRLERPKEPERIAVKRVLGNHDEAMKDDRSYAVSNKLAKVMFDNHRQKLTQGQIEYLVRVPYVTRRGNLTISHSCLSKPENYRYVIDKPENLALQLEFAHMKEGEILFIGHTHKEGIHYCIDGEITTIVPQFAEGFDELSYVPKGKTIVNVGSLGQPRVRDLKAEKKDLRASYATYEEKIEKNKEGEIIERTEEIKFHRIEYDMDTTLAKIDKLDIPEGAKRGLRRMWMQEL